MKALSIKNPWASAILAGDKDVENRSWRPSVAMPFTMAVHVGKTFDEFASTFHSSLLDREACAHQAGTLCGVVDVVSVHHASSCRLACSQWAADDQWHWVLANARQVEPVPWRGQLGIFTIPDNALRASTRDRVEP